MSDPKKTEAPAAETQVTGPHPRFAKVLRVKGRSGDHPAVVAYRRKMDSINQSTMSELEALNARLDARLEKAYTDPPPSSVTSSPDHPPDSSRSLSSVTGSPNHPMDGSRSLASVPGDDRRERDDDARRESTIPIDIVEIHPPRRGKP